MTILFSEGSSLTAREFLNVLGPRGHRIEVLDSSPICICAFSRWTKKLHRCPPAGKDPVGYLAKVHRLLETGRYDVLLPTHEQAWLFAAARAAVNAPGGEKLFKHTKIALAQPESFAKVQSKIEFARLLDEVRLPQPGWEIIDSAGALEKRQPPYYLKAPYSTAGTGVRLVSSRGDPQAAFGYLRKRTKGGPLLLQQVENGIYAQVQGLFDHGRLVAAHSSMQTLQGVGSSAAGRMSVSHPFAGNDIAALGKYLNWHGGLTVDYIFRGNDRYYIECNPRSVEPGNAVAAGVDLPGLQLEISLGKHPAAVPPGRPNVRTHGATAVLLGAAANGDSRQDILRQAFRLFFARNGRNRSREALTPVLRDLPGSIPLFMVIAAAMYSPRVALYLSRGSIDRYSVTLEAVNTIASALTG